MNKEKIIDIIYQIINEINGSHPDEDRIIISPDSVLDPQYGGLSSLNLIYFLVGVEERVNILNGKSVNIVEEFTKLTDDSVNVLSSIDNFANFLIDIL